MPVPSTSEWRKWEIQLIYFLGSSVSLIVDVMPVVVPSLAASPCLRQTRLSQLRNVSGRASKLHLKGWAIVPASSSVMIHAFHTNALEVTTHKEPGLCGPYFEMVKEIYLITTQYLVCILSTCF